MIILSNTDAEKAKRLMREVMQQRRKVTLVVFGDPVDGRAREVASRADVRADDHPARQVVWAPNPSLLDGEEFALLRELAAAGTEAAFFTLEFALSSTIGGADAMRFLRLEIGFARALAGETSS